MLPILKRIGPSPRPLNIRGIVTSSREPILTLRKDGPTPPGYPLKVDRTVLEGGVQVLSVDSFSPITTLSMFVKAGSRYENRTTANSARFLKHLAFKGTHQKSALRLLRDLEHIGATLNTCASRETVSYHLCGIRNPESSDSLNLNIIVETLRYLLNPLLLEYEIRAVKPVVAWEASTLNENPEKRIIEFLHSEGFRDSGLGLPLVAEYAISEVTGQKILNHVRRFYYPGERISIVATGIDHSHLLKKLTPLFTTPTLQGKYHEVKALLPLPKETPTSQTSIFVGGSSLRIPDLGNTHVGIAYPGSPITKNDHVVLEVLKEILGGGAKTKNFGINFKDSRFFRNILVKDPNILEMSTFNFGYSDAGLFGVYAAATSGHGRDLTHTLVDELQAVTSGISPEEVQRGRSMVKRRFLSEVTKDRFRFATHMAVVGVPILDYVGGIDGVTVEDVHRVAKAVMSVSPVLVSVGDVRGVPRLDK